jgi:hypothetical protein
MNDYVALFSKTLAEGVSFEEALSRLRDAGSTPAEFIKAIHCVQGVTLREAKQLFGTSTAWSGEVLAGDVLHREIQALLPNESSIG